MPVVNAVGDQSILEHLYDVALDPISYERLLEYWNGLIEPTLEGAQPEGVVTASVSPWVGHMERADRVLAQTMESQLVESAEVAVQAVRHSATFAVDSQGRLEAVNAPTSAMFGVTVGGRVLDLPLEPGEALRLQELCGEMLRQGTQTPRAMCVRSRGAGRLIVLHVRCVRLVGDRRVALCVSSEIAWPSGFEQMLRESFALSAAEIEVLRHLTEGYGVADIAEIRSRSPETVRVQVKSMLSKTAARSQLELVRLALSLVEMLRAGGDAADESNPSPLPPVLRNRVVLAGGRQLEYLILGSPTGKPVLFFPIDLGFTRWTPQAEAEARRRKLKVIVPIRPGYDGSTPLPERGDYMAQLIADLLSLLDQLGVRERLPVLTMGDDSLFALQLHHADKQRFSALVCCGGVMPFTHPAQYQRMGKWHRFIVTSAKFTPQFLPFIVKAGAALARRYGKQQFLSSIYEGSAADSATFALPEVRETLVQCTDIMLSHTHSAHEAFAKELIAKAQADWTAPLASLQAATEAGELGVHFFNGEQDPQVHHDTLAEFQRDYPWIDFSIYPDAGQLILYLKWRDVLDVVGRYV